MPWIAGAEQLETLPEPCSVSPHASSLLTLTRARGSPRCVHAAVTVVWRLHLQDRMAWLGADITVATAWGPGVGRFLAEALVDALQSDLHLVAVEESAHAPADGLRGVDFVFAHDHSSHEEIIRVGLDAHGHVVSAALIRRRARQCQRSAGAEQDLLDAIRSGESVSALHWIDRPASTAGREGAADERTPRRTLTITVRSDRSFQISLGN
jgi:hypothetical protein